MRYRLTIQGTLPGLNSYIDAERNHRQRAADLKRRTESAIGLIARTQLGSVNIKSPVKMHYRWIEPNRRRDKDNIAFARKFVQDALVRAGYLKNDGWSDIAGFTDEFGVDRHNPRIIIEIEETEQC